MVFRRIDQLSEEVEETMDMHLKRISHSSRAVCNQTDITKNTPEHESYKTLYLLYGACYQLLYDIRGQHVEITVREPAREDSAQQIVELLVARAVAAARADIADGVAVSLWMGDMSLAQVSRRFRVAVAAVDAWIKSSTTNKVPSSICATCVESQKESTDLQPADDVSGFQASSYTTVKKLADIAPLAEAITTSRVTTFNPAAFKRLRAGRSGQRNHTAPDGVPMQYHLTQKRASKHGAAKKPLLTIDLCNDAAEAQARLFSHSAAAEIELTLPARKMMITLVVTWNEKTFRSTVPSKREAKTDIEVTDLGGLVAFAIVMVDHAQQDEIDGGWPERQGSWQWDTKYPDIKTVVTNRRLN